MGTLYSIGVKRDVVKEGSITNKFEAEDISEVTKRIVSIVLNRARANDSATLAVVTKLNKDVGNTIACEILHIEKNLHKQVTDDDIVELLVKHNILKGV